MQVFMLHNLWPHCYGRAQAASCRNTNCISEIMHSTVQHKQHVKTMNALIGACVLVFGCRLRVSRRLLLLVIVLWPAVVTHCHPSVVVVSLLFVHELLNSARTCATSNNIINDAQVL